MRKLESRIVALEGIAHATGCALGRAIGDALNSLGRSGIELLVRACGADFAGRTLTEAEINARQLYQESLKRRCREARIPYPSQLDHRLYIKTAIIHLMSVHLTTSQLMLVGSAHKVLHEGGIPSEDEVAALRAYITEMQRWERLATGTMRTEGING